MRRSVLFAGFLLAGSLLACDDDGGLGQDARTPDAALADEPKTPGDDRAGRVSCGPSSCSLEGQGVCCFEDDADGACVSPRVECGVDDHGFGCDGPEDCASGRVCCAVAPRTASCEATCTADTLCHAQADCLGHERCEASERGYALCVSDDVRETPGFEGKGRVFCGDDSDDTTACEEGEACCVSDGKSRCAVSCSDDEASHLCDGPEDCTADALCVWDDGDTRCEDPAGRPTDGEPFVCHDSEDCSGYGCEPRADAPLLGFCNPETGT